MGERDVLGLWAALGVSALAVGASLGAACIMEDDRCGPYQVRLPDQNLCVCTMESVLNPDGPGCLPCGPNEWALDEKCVCKSGFTRPSEEALCEKSAGSTLGQPCSADAPCSEPNPYCATVGRASYCTRTGCTTHEDCPESWVCAQEGDFRICRLQLGFLRECTSQEDCAGTEATYCETYQIRRCLVQGCLADKSVCASRQVCCDLRQRIGVSVCVGESNLMAGRCVDGKEPVRP